MIVPSACCVTIKPSKSSPAVKTTFGRPVVASVLFCKLVALDASGVLAEASSTVAGTPASEASAAAIGRITGALRGMICTPFESQTRRPALGFHIFRNSATWKRVVLVGLKEWAKSTGKESCHPPRSKSLQTERSVAMKCNFSGLLAAALAGLMLLSSQALAQQKTVRACQEEWRANKAANQAQGITEKAYVAQCRGQGTTAQPTTPSVPTPATSAAAGGKTAKACRDEWRANKAANQANGVTEKAYVEQCRTGAAVAPPSFPAPSSTTAAPAPAPSQIGAGSKTVRACRDEWRANKAANQANRITEKAYVEQCRTGTAAAQPSAPPYAPPPPAAQPAPSQTTAAPAPAQRPAPPATSTSLGTNQFSAEWQAKAHCPGDTVVWANLRSHIYHFNDTRFYGTTENGAYMCEREAVAAGVRAAKNETHP